MRNIRTRFTILTAFAIMISVFATIMIVGFSVSSYVDMKSEDVLRLVCAARQESLDNYFNSIEQSVDTVANYAEKDYSSSVEDIEGHLKRTEQLFSTIADNTRGTLTYYYRIAPEIGGESSGFWYQKDGNGEFASSELTVIGKYDPDDISRVGWYYIPKSKGEPVWIDPYNNINLGAKIISYVVPIYYGGRFLGVIGMDFSYENLVAHVGDIDEFESGYAFLTELDGSIVYHKDIEAGTSIMDVVPDRQLDPYAADENGILRYTYQGVEKRAASAKLSNDMIVYVTVTESEISSGLRRIITSMLASAVAVLALFTLLTSMAVKRITLPLSELTKAAAALDSGNYDAEVAYEGNDEIGILANAFRQMRDHLKSHIGSLSEKAFKDNLTSVRNKSAFDSYAGHLDELINDHETEGIPEFAICMFDCNDLKEINDTYGHDRGDTYLRNTCRLICDIFRHSAVFRAGGDEFIAVLQNQDYENRDAVCRLFNEKASESITADNEPWEKINVALGMAVYDPEKDTCTAEVLKRADEIMYAEKSAMKNQHLIP